MEDLQMNISVAKAPKKSKAPQKGAKDYKFVSNPTFTGKTLARKRPTNSNQFKTFPKKNDEGPPKKVLKLLAPAQKNDEVSVNLRDLSENKGKYQGKSYQDLSDDLQLKQKPRSGAWISSLFKNNPDVPRMGQRAVKTLVEKVFSGKNFSDLDIHPHSVANLQQNLNLKELMTVQQNSIPVILQGRDVFIRSQTGSGKTLAYALPLIEGLQAIRPKINRHNGVRAVIVVPTRELAVQSYELLVKLVKPFTWIVPGLLSGGQKRSKEKARLRKGLNILVGTPGRINDHLRHTQSLNFSRTGCLILDEADLLLDMGYEKDVAAIIRAIEDHKKNATYDPMAMMRQEVTKKVFDEEETGETPKESNEEETKEKNEIKTEIKHHLTNIFLSKERQTILLSATLTKAVEHLAGITMTDPVFIDTSEGRAVVADSLTPIGYPGSSVKESPTAESKAKKTVKENKETVKIETKSDRDDVPEETKRGLKQFSGSIHPDLFANDDESNKAVPKKPVPVNNAEDSDSDSDYEFFKVQKELATKDTKEESDVEEEKPCEEKKETGNLFSNALKSAIEEDELLIPASVKQTFLVVPMKLRLVTLCSLIVEHCMNKKGKMIVFMATLEMVDYHSELIETVLTGKDQHKKKDKAKATKKKGEDEKSDSDSSDSEFGVDYQAPLEGGLVPLDVDVFSLHGSMPHEQRIEVFKQFRAAKRGVLFCTDVAARGIDVPRVDLVLQYCAPGSATDYVHRVGRTGRATQVGAAVMFLLPSETEFVRYLEERRIRLRQVDETKALESLCAVAPAATGPARAAIAVQTRLEQVTHGNREWLARASRAYTSWVRFYSCYPREVRPLLDARQLHLGHAAKAFALRDTPAALAKRTRQDPRMLRGRPANRLTVKEDDERKRKGFPRVKVGSHANKIVNKQSSMHTASEFDSGMPAVDKNKMKKKN